jgi:hypothetical protein
LAYLDISSSYNLEDSQSFLDFGPAKANPDRLPDRPGFDVRGRLQPVVVKRRRYGVRLGRGWKKTTRRGEGRTFLHTPTTCLCLLAFDYDQRTAAHKATAALRSA